MRSISALFHTGKYRPLTSAWILANAVSDIVSLNFHYTTAVAGLESVATNLPLPQLIGIA